jgi:hypothetical protein
MDYLDKQGLKQQLEILIAKKIDYECEIMILEKEIEQIQKLIGDEQ